jgi:hypothetical protein
MIDLESSFAFRHSTNKALLSFAGILSLFTCSLAAVKGGAWIVGAIFCSVFFFIYLVLANTKLGISPRGCSYRGLNRTRSRFIDFDQIDKAYFEEDRRGDVPVAAFWVQLRDGDKLQIPLALFPIKASALLFTHLDRRGVPIAQPSTPITQRASEEIRSEQVRILGMRSS